MTCKFCEAIRKRLAIKRRAGSNPPAPRGDKPAPPPNPPRKPR